MLYLGTTLLYMSTIVTGIPNARVSYEGSVDWQKIKLVKSDELGIENHFQL